MKINLYHSCNVQGVEQANCLARGLEKLGDRLLASSKKEHDGFHYTLSRKGGELYFEKTESKEGSSSFIIKKVSQFFGLALKYLALLCSSQLRAKYTLLAAHEEKNLKPGSKAEERLFGPLTTKKVEIKDGCAPCCATSCLCCVGTYAAAYSCCRPAGA